MNTDLNPNAAADGGADPEGTPPAAPLSFGQRLAAAGDALAGRGDAAEAAGLRTQLATVTGERDQLRTSLDAAQASITTLQTDLSAARARLQEAEAAVTEFEARVQSASIARVAAAGIPAEQLPAIGANGEDPAIALRTELAETTDPAKKGQIAAKLLALRAGKN